MITQKTSNITIRPTCYLALKKKKRLWGIYPPYPPVNTPMIVVVKLDLMSSTGCTNLEFSITNLYKLNNNY